LHWSEESGGSDVLNMDGDWCVWKGHAKRKLFSCSCICLSVLRARHTGVEDEQLELDSHRIMYNHCRKVIVVPVVHEGEQQKF
jgi:hypothetical protein